LVGGGRAVSVLGRFEKPEGTGAKSVDVGKGEDVEEGNRAMPEKRPKTALTTFNIHLFNIVIERNKRG
jgi:hypothetical protein